MKQTKKREKISHCQNIKIINRLRMTQLLELSGSEFKITMNNISKALVEKVDNMYE